MKAFFYSGYTGFVDILSFLVFLISWLGACRPMFAEVVLLHELGQHCRFKTGTLHGGFVLTAVLIAGMCVRRERLGHTLAGALHYAEGELDSAGDDRLVGLPTAYEE